MPGCERFAAGFLLTLKTSGSAVKGCPQKAFASGEGEASCRKPPKAGRLSPGQRTVPFRAAGRQCRREAVSLLFKRPARNMPF